METITMVAGFGSLLFALLALVAVVLIVGGSTLVLVYGLVHGGSEALQELAALLRPSDSGSPLRG